MFRATPSLLLALSIVATIGSVLGVAVHFYYAHFIFENIDIVEENHNYNLHKHAVLITLYLQLPQHVLEIFCLVLLGFGLKQSKRQLMLPWLIANAIGIGLYSTILLVMAMILSPYLLFGYILIASYGYLWYCIQCYYTAMAQLGDSDTIYTIME